MMPKYSYEGDAIWTYESIFVVSVEYDNAEAPMYVTLDEFREESSTTMRFACLKNKDINHRVCRDLNENECGLRSK